MSAGLRSTISTSIPGRRHAPRGRSNSRGRVALPDGWLDAPYEQVVRECDTELDTSGG
ncbi:hypothetical protein [Nonomuraea sp. NPDC049400]|uniref:hypothetical protein n=1 Tax=Nonomuraea sp. NPDC049400 TaxID=3364352 RepID=UPI0037B1FD7C